MTEETGTKKEHTKPCHEFGENLVTDADIDAVWGNANFGNTPRRKVLDDALFQIAGGYATGHTAMCICQELKLVGKARGRYQNLTKKGKRYLYDRYKQATKPPPAPDDAALDALEKLKNAVAECKSLSDMGNDYHQQGTIDGHSDLASVGITKMIRARYELGGSCQMIFTPEFLRTIEQALTNACKENR